MIPNAIDEKLIGKIKKIKLLLLDVDGVLTDGRIIYDSDGRHIKFFYVHDGLGIRLLRSVDIKTILITAKQSKALEKRADEIKVDKCYQGVEHKAGVLDEILTEYHVEKDEICYVGDDLFDMGIMKLIGFPVAVANACREINDVAHYVTQKPGGHGAVREVTELILKTQGTWEKALKLVIGA